MQHVDSASDFNEEEEEEELEEEALGDEEEEEEVDVVLATVKELNSQIASFVPMPIIYELEYYMSFEGVISLTVAPFTQGLFHGLGEGFARIVVGSYLMGLDPFIALGGRKDYSVSSSSSSSS